MSTRDLDKRPIFFLSTTTDGSPPLVTIAVPAGAWDYMKDGHTHTFDLTSIGVPVQIMLFGAESHDAAMKTIEDVARANGIAILDERRRDFSIKPKRGN